MKYLAHLHNEIKKEAVLHCIVKIMAFVEECPSAYFPTFYKYEGEIYENENQIYKDKTTLEKVFLSLII